MFLLLIICFALLVVGASLLLDDMPGNDGIGEFFAGTGAMGALIISGIMLWRIV